MNTSNSVWRGVHISALQTSFNRYQHPKLISNDEHTILVKIPVIVDQVPECYPSVFNRQDYWDQNHVKLPCSEKNITKDHKSRWGVMREVFTDILSSQQLEAAILSYNKRYTDLWNFSTLHSFFEDILEESESIFFFETLLPKIIELALCLPQMVTSGIPLLRQGYKHSLSLSQLQISCLLANAFLCTFPHRNWNKRNSEYFDYPDINFNRLFQCEDASRTTSVHEKLKCIINYFRRVTMSAPTGVVTYSRQLVPNNLYPEWLKSNNKLTKLHISSSGTIEDDGFGFFQVDFANKFVGGGVIGTGCVQEEIRFVVCPELILSRLFTQVLGENEALVVTGCERFNRYRGYGSTFEWDGDYVDQTPSDEYGRKYCTVIALDALCFSHNPIAQYLPENMLRDLNKAYVGFSWGSRRKKEELCAIATGNWGCGAFAGDPQLKSIIQLLAAAEVGRDLAYFTFGDERLRDSMASIHQFLSENAISVGKICHLLKLYNDKKVCRNIDLFEFLRIEAVKKEESVAPKEPYSNSSSTSKMFKVLATPNLAMNKERSFFCRTKTNDEATKESNEKTLGPLEQFKKRHQQLTQRQDSAFEEGLKRDELQMLTGIYGTAVMTSGNDDHPQPDTFDFLDRFKQKIGSRLTKKQRVIQKKVEPELPKDEHAIREDDTVAEEQIEKGIESASESQLSEKKQRTQEVKTSHKFERLEDREVKTSKTFNLLDEETSRLSINEDENLSENASLIENNIPKINAKSDFQLHEKPMDETEKENINEGEVMTPPVSRVTLSQLSLRLSKSEANKRKYRKERVNQKRKISDYFNPLNKKSNNSQFN